MRAIDRLAAALDCAAALAACVLLGGDCAPQLILSLSLHEAAHLAAIRLAGVRRVRFASAGIGFRIAYPAAALSRAPRLAVSLAGCAANAALAAVSTALGAYRLAAVNVSLAAFNLLPIEGLDGGEALSAILSDRAEPARAYVVCRASSLAFSAALWLFSVYVQLRLAAAPEILLVSTFLMLRELTKQ